MRPTWCPPGADRTQVGPCWPHEPCYQGIHSDSALGTVKWNLTVFFCQEILWLIYDFIFTKHSALRILQHVPVLNVFGKLLHVAMNLRHIHYYVYPHWQRVDTTIFALSSKYIMLSWILFNKCLLGTTLASIFSLSIIHKNVGCNYSSMPKFQQWFLLFHLLFDLTVDCFVNYIMYQPYGPLKWLQTLSWPRGKLWYLQYQHVGNKWCMHQTMHRPTQ